MVLEITQKLEVIINKIICECTMSEVYIYIYTYFYTHTHTHTQEFNTVKNQDV